MIVDLICSAFLAMALISGFRTGFIPSVFSLIGYFGGGLAGLIVAKRLTDDWNGIPSIILFLVVAIFLGAQIGQWLTRRIGRGFRTLIGPLKAIDGFLGAILTLARALLAIYFLVSLISLTGWGQGLEVIADSRIVDEINQRVPSALSQLFDELRNQLPN
ncbi:MAG: CvpA family protein [Actinobacteria bacterium]|nr:CvpA family protein [Actinomycetota bacterium]